MTRNLKSPAGQTAPKIVCVTGATPAPLEPEYIRLSDMQRMFSIKRGTCYTLLRAGKIKGLTFREPGQRRGTRLFLLSSVRSYLKSRMEAPQ